MEDVALVEVNFPFEILWRLDLDTWPAMSIGSEAIDKRFIADAVETFEIQLLNLLLFCVVVLLEQSVRHIESK